MPTDIIWKYTLKQIYRLYNLILKREVEEKNQLVRIIQAGYSGMEQDFISIRKDKDTNVPDEKKLGEIGMRSDSYYKNYNPNLVLKKEGEK